MCYELQMVPEDYHAIASPMECIKGGAIGGMTFVIAHAEYTMKGWHCVTKPPMVSDISNWVEERKAMLSRTEPQIKWAKCPQVYFTNPADVAAAKAGV